MHEPRASHATRVRLVGRGGTTVLPCPCFLYPVLSCPDHALCSDPCIDLARAPPPHSAPALAHGLRCPVLSFAVMSCVVLSCPVLSFYPLSCTVLCLVPLSCCPAILSYPDLSCSYPVQQKLCPGKTRPRQVMTDKAKQNKSRRDMTRNDKTGQDNTELAASINKHCKML